MRTGWRNFLKHMLVIHRHPMLTCFKLFEARWSQQAIRKVVKYHLSPWKIHSFGGKKCSSLLPAVPWNKHHWFILGHHPGDRFRQISPHLKSGGCKNWFVPDCSPRPDSLDCHGLSTSFPRASTLRKSSSFDVWWKTLWTKPLSSNIAYWKIAELEFDDIPLRV